MTVFDKYVFTGGADARIKKWDITSCRPMFTYLGHKQKINKILVTEDVVFSTSGDGTAKVRFSLICLIRFLLMYNYNVHNTYYRMSFMTFAFSILFWTRFGTPKSNSTIDINHASGPFRYTLHLVFLFFYFVCLAPASINESNVMPQKSFGMARESEKDANVNLVYFSPLYYFTKAHLS